jgi:hypothetical protein
MGSRRAFLVVGAAGLAGAVGFPLLRLGHAFRPPPAARASRGGPPDASLETTLKPPIVGS